MPDPLANKTVVVTGASSGIGKSVAELCLARGAHVYLAGPDEARLGATASELKQRFERVAHQVCDVRSNDSVRRLVGAAVAATGRVDVLINNAGYGTYRTFEASPLDEIVDLVDVNLTGAMRCAREVLPTMIRQGSGAIVNVSSIAGQAVITPNAVYCGAKHGLAGWSGALRSEVRRFGISVSVVFPGLTRTSFHDHPTFAIRHADRASYRRGMEPERVARAVVDAAITGQAELFVPWWHRVLVWSLASLGPLTRPGWNRLQERRIRAYYQAVDGDPGRK